MALTNLTCINLCAPSPSPDAVYPKTETVSPESLYILTLGARDDG